MGLLVAFPFKLFLWIAIEITALPPANIGGALVFTFTFVGNWVDLGISRNRKTKANAFDKLGF
jgi:hypothetical protein